MSTLMTNPEVKIMSVEDKLHLEISDLRQANYALQMELSALRSDNPMSIMQSKVMRQAKALNVLNRRIRTQRLVLRQLNELGRDLTVEEWTQLKAANAEHFEFETPLYI